MSETDIAWNMLSLGRPGPESNRLVAAKAGDRRAFDELVRTYEAGLQRFIARRVPEHAIDDVRQETLLASWTGLSRYAGKSAFRTWLFSIALHKCRDFNRQRKPDAELTVEPTDLGTFHLVEMRADVRRALAKLNAEQRELLELYYEEEMSLREIAEVLGRNVNTLKYQFYRAHEAFAAHYGEHYGG
jgi:RNA polymerase sigma-70 factor, ECF subfamily